MRLQSWLACALLFLSQSANAVIPEVGMWWNSEEPGRGYYIDVQADTLFFLAYAYDADGRPSFFGGSGTLRTGFGEIFGFGYPQISGPGYEPWHFATVELFRFEGGACLTCGHRAPRGTSIGSVGLYFDSVSRVVAYFSLADGTFAYRFMTRFNYNYAPFTSDSPGTAPRVPDLRGDWVFVDTIDRTVPAWRFNFTRVEQSVPNIERTTPPPWTVTFFDDTRKARLVCRQEPAGGLSPNARESACQLLIGDAPIFWARLRDDLGVDRIQAAYGAVGTIGAGYRGQGVILGTRVE